MVTTLHFWMMILSEQCLNPVGHTKRTLVNSRGVSLDVSCLLMGLKEKAIAKRFWSFFEIWTLRIWSRDNFRSTGTMILQDMLKLRWLQHVRQLLQPLRWKFQQLTRTMTLRERNGCKTDLTFCMFYDLDGISIR